MSPSPISLRISLMSGIAGPSRFAKLPFGRTLMRQTTTGLQLEIAAPLGRARAFSTRSSGYHGSSVKPALGAASRARLTAVRSSSTSAGSSNGRSCPNCSAEISPTTTPCPSCSTLIPLPSGLSHHSLFSLSEPVPSPGQAGTYDIPAELAMLPARGFTLDTRDLRQRMLGRQRDLHPDRFGSKGERVVSLAKELSGRVNMAYDKLLDPLKRAEYILSVHDLSTGETDSLTDPMLLAEILEAREELEEAESEEQVDQLRKANHGKSLSPLLYYTAIPLSVPLEYVAKKVQTSIVALTEAFSVDPPDLQEAKSLAVQLKYWLGLEAAAKEWAPGKGAGPSAGSAFTHS